MYRTRIIRIIQVTASFKTIGTLFLSTVALFIMNMMMGEAAMRYNVASEAQCTIVPQLAVNQESDSVEVSINCSGAVYELLLENEQLISLVNMSPKERSARTLSCKIYSLGNATCALPAT